MSVVNLIKSVVIGGSVIALVGCASGHHKHARLKGSGIGDNAKFYGEELTPEQEQELLAKNTLYFGFDRYDVSDADRLAVLAHAKKLIENPSAKMKIAGHTDERGSRAYNLGLGERRAKAVSQILESKGVSADRVTVISYGKEKPVALGNTEESWSQNRRAEMEYEG